MGVDQAKIKYYKASKFLQSRKTLFTKEIDRLRFTFLLSVVVITIVVVGTIVFVVFVVVVTVGVAVLSVVCCCAMPSPINVQLYCLRLLLLSNTDDNFNCIQELTYRTRISTKYESQG